MCRVGWPWWTPSKTERKGNEMNNDENWENEIDWSRRTAVVGGPIFYDFVKTQAIPALEEGPRQMAAAKAESERKLQRWGAIAERAANLSDCFAALTGEPDFMRMVHDNRLRQAARHGERNHRRPQGHHRRLAQDAGHLPPREEGHQAARRPLLVEARRVERHAQRRLTRLSKRIAHKARHVAASTATPAETRLALVGKTNASRRRRPPAAGVFVASPSQGFWQRRQNGGCRLGSQKVSQTTRETVRKQQLAIEKA